MSSGLPVSYLQHPSTSNAYTTDPQPQLMRSPGKMGQVLASAPYLVDNRHVGVTVRIDLPLEKSKRANHHTPSYEDADEEHSEIAAFRMMPSLSRTDTNTSLSSIDSSCSDDSAGDVPQIAHVEVRVLRSRRNRNQNTQPPVVPPSFRVEPVPAASSSSSHAPYRHPDEGTSSRYAIRPAPDSVVEPQRPFTFQSDVAFRRDKLDRLKRRLGDGVPVNMVFPTDTAPSQDPEADEQRIENAGHPKPAARRRRALWF